MNLPVSQPMPDNAISKIPMIDLIADHPVWSDAARDQDLEAQILKAMCDHDPDSCPEDFSRSIF